MSRPTSKERCPKCASRGMDTSGDNLIVYSDGHKWCFGCGYHVPGDIRSRLRKEESFEEPSIVLPHDCDYSYPKKALEWCSKYYLTKNDLLVNHVVWSESYQRLFFPVFDQTGLLGFQGRYFGNEDKVKWWGKGDLKNIQHILGTNDRPIIVLTEDIISAIRVSKYYRAMPLFGCHLPLKLFERLSIQFKEIVIWLDPDKRKEAIVGCPKASSVGLKCQIIFSDKDPKEYDDETLKEYLCLK